MKRRIETVLIWIAIAFTGLVLLTSAVLHLSGCAPSRTMTIEGVVGTQQAEGKRFICLNQTANTFHYVLYSLDHDLKTEGKFLVIEGDLMSQDHFDITVDYGYGRYILELSYKSLEGGEKFTLPIRASKGPEIIHIKDPPPNKEVPKGGPKL